MNNNLSFFNTIQDLKKGYFLNRSEIRKNILKKDNISYLNFKNEYHNELNQIKNKRTELLNKTTFKVLNILNINNNTLFEFGILQKMLIMLINDELETYSVDSLIKYHLLFQESNNNYKKTSLYKKIDSFYLSNQKFVA